jgi:hypothetical protein
MGDAANAYAEASRFYDPATTPPNDNWIKDIKQN